MAFATEISTRVAAPSPGHAYLRKLLSFMGPGYLVAVGYMDPGNWATDLAGGSQFGYALLSVVLLSGLVAMFLQRLALRLGIATGRDLAQLCRERFSPRVSFSLWITCEAAIVACDLAEMIGTAIALKLLFGMPLLAGVAITLVTTLAIMGLQARSLRSIEALAIVLVGIVGACLAAELVLCGPHWRQAIAGAVPSAEIVANPSMLYVALGIFGATVMPHNLYLHSAIARSRCSDGAPWKRRQAMHFSTVDCFLALGVALAINAAILMLAAAAFHVNGYTGVAGIEQAYTLLSPVLGSTLAAFLFAVALLAAGQNSTVTGTMAGQIVMEGFLDIRMRPAARRLLTRSVAVVPAVLVLGLMGEAAAGRLLIFSQVVLSLQLGFAVVPLLIFTADRRLMKSFASTRPVAAVGWALGVLIVTVNGWLVVQAVVG
jgi:manganese transport protein